MIEGNKRAKSMLDGAVNKIERDRVKDGT